VAVKHRLELRTEGTPANFFTNCLFFLTSFVFSQLVETLLLMTERYTCVCMHELTGIAIEHYTRCSELWRSIGRGVVCVELLLQKTVSETQEHPLETKCTQCEKCIGVFWQESQILHDCI